ncbi:stage III sporulation protein AB [Amphibacillus marinus]|uniref:Stage III sporulation protein AB n=1 Tax=Amphibacillus marinus TaxID=872970 RepID=A0A1H8NLJ6_9BACI|nr:stage III sporulation protein SpoIIIAB [Amphibacillus marinus]SEO30591.1 stage III sporulation protein AB [Amphibacillus marinus]
MNWIGAILLITATSLIGFEYAERLKQRPKQILQLKVALQIMESEIIYSYTTIGQICLKIAEQSPKPCNYFFASIGRQLSYHDNLSTLWNSELIKLKNCSALKQQEIDILKQFGYTLGTFDAKEQRKQTQLACVHLDRLFQEAQVDHLKLGKVYQGIGLLSGILMTLVLM